MNLRMLPPAVSGNHYSLDLDKVLGEGSFGKVYLGHSLSLPEQPVAIKLPKMELQRSSFLHACQKTMLETGLLQRTSSPRVVRCLDYNKDISFPYMVLEYIPHTLRTVPLTSEVIEDYIAQVPQVLAELEEKCLAHCDLREENVGYVSRTVKLLDFGLAIPLERVVFHPRLPALPYHPPELKMAHLVTRTADTYSAGRLLEHLLTGEYSPSVSLALQKIRKKHGAAPPPSLQRLLMSMLRREHFRRPAPDELENLAQEAVRDLRQCAYFSKGSFPALNPAEINFFGTSSGHLSSSPISRHDPHNHNQGKRYKKPISGRKRKGV